MPVLLLLVLPVSLLAECVAVDGDNILARHLAGRMAAFRALNPEEPLGLAPAAGVNRFLTADELRKMAERAGLELSAATPLCITQSLETLSREAIENALRASLAPAGPPGKVALEVLDYSRHALPGGRLEFPLSALNRPPGGDTRAPVYWRGRIRQPGGRSYPVWAKVRVSVRAARVVAAVELPAGSAILPSALRLDEIDEPPSHNSGGSTPSTDPAEFAGRVTRRKIRAGEPVHIGMLLARRDVERGQSVAVEVRSGAARLTFDGRAESTGKTGDQILVRNQTTGKRFRATIDGPGRVSVGALNEMENSNASDNLERSSARVDRLSAVHGGTQKAGR